MRITVLRKMRYEDRFIYVMQFGTVFQYLFAEDDDIYQNNIVYRPNFFLWVLWKLNIRSTPYTPSQLEEGERVILSGAMETIDKVKDPNYVKDDPATRQRDAAQKQAMEQGDSKCLWQTRQVNNKEFYYMCLRHGKAVKMKEGETPKHD